MPDDMDPTIRDYPQEKLAMVGTGLSLGSLRMPPVRKILEDQIKEIERQLEARKLLLAELDKQPDTERLLDALRRVGI